MMDIMVTRSHMSQSDNIGRTPQFNVQGDQLHRMTSVQDKFLISAVSVTGEDMSPHHINHQLKQSKPDAQYRLRCLMGEEKVTDKSQNIDPVPLVCVQIPPKSNGTAGSATEMMDIKKEATKVNKKLADVVEKLENLEMQIKMILYGGIAILSLNVLMLFIYLIWGS